MVDLLHESVLSRLREWRVPTRAEERYPVLDNVSLRRLPVPLLDTQAQAGMSDLRQILQMKAELPNEAASGKGGIAPPLQAERFWPTLPEHERSATLRA
jgi:hypothetical protein